MPFITEELWQALNERKPGESITIAQQPKANRVDEKLIADFDTTKQIIAGIRTIRLQKNIPNKDELLLQIIGSHNNRYDAAIVKMAILSSIETVLEKSTGAMGFLVGTTEFAIPLEDKIDVEAELEKLTTELKYTEGFLLSVQKKLSNERFVQNAKPEIVENERKKQADAESKIALLKENIEALSAQQL
jgi:valyl-tRNA synthetase